MAQAQIIIHSKFTENKEEDYDNSGEENSCHPADVTHPQEGFGFFLQWRWTLL